MKATVLLRNDHETMRSLVAKLRQPTRGKDRDSQFEHARREILMHLQIEDELFYPELVNAPAADGNSVTTALQHHREIEDLLNETGPNASSKAVDALAEKMEEHFRFEEETLMERARRTLSEPRLEELGLEMEERRRFMRLAA